MHSKAEHVGPEATVDQPRQFEIINISRPEDAAIKETRRKVRSNAARNSEGRKQRVIKHQLERTQALDQVCNPKQSRETRKKAAAAIGPVASVWLAWPVPNPMEMLSAARRDPFNSSARSVTPFEGFLLDHCMFICSTLGYPKSST